MSGKRSRSFKCAVHQRDREVSSENDFHVLAREPPAFRKMVRLIADEFLTEERDRKYYADHYSCCPPPLFVVFVTLLELGFFTYYTVATGEMNPSGPVPIDSVFIYRPDKRLEVWRFVFYMVLHAGWLHLLFNLLVQLLVGLPLEMVHGSLRIGAVYMAGVLAASPPRGQHACALDRPRLSRALGAGLSRDRAPAVPPGLGGARLSSDLAGTAAQPGTLPAERDPRRKPYSPTMVGLGREAALEAMYRGWVALSVAAVRRPARILPAPGRHGVSCATRSPVARGQWACRCSAARRPPPAAAPPARRGEEAPARLPGAARAGATRKAAPRRPPDPRRPPP
ncbi:Rhomboid-like protein [Gryllus bimaculatus]|nr:Rhomboid-like protein [Gryllus bimaculatus]